MDKTTKHYAEKIYKYGSKPIFEEVEYKNPVLLDDENIAAVRFFDQEFIEQRETLIPQKRDNFTNWICYGTRWKIEDAMQKWPDDSAIQKNLNNFLEYGYNDVCCTKDGLFIPLEQGDITYTEFVNPKPSIQIDNEMFMESISNTKIPLEELYRKTVSCINIDGDCIKEGPITRIGLDDKYGTIGVDINGVSAAYISNYSPVNQLIDDEGNYLYKNDFASLRLVHNVDSKWITLIEDFGRQPMWDYIRYTFGANLYYTEMATIIILKLEKAILSGAISSIPEVKGIAKIEDSVYQKMLFKDFNLDKEYCNGDGDNRSLGESYIDYQITEICKNPDLYKKYKKYIEYKKTLPRKR